MANKFAEDIRRIAKGTRFKGALGLYHPRDPILESQVALITDPLALGGGYGNGGLNNETPSSEAPNSETEQEENEGDENPAQDPNNPNTFYKGGAGTTTSLDSAAKEGSFDAEGIIDGTAGPQTTNGTSGGINEITGMTDCESETPFNLQLDGNFPVPEGWDDAETPPETDPPVGYEEGFYWHRLDECPSPDPVSVYECIINNSPSVIWISGVVASLSGSSALVDYTVQFVSTGTISTFRDGATKSACGSSSPDIVAACNYVPPEITSWPEDGIFELANKDGNLVTSDFDADAPEQYSSSGKDFCFGEDRTGKILITSDGGTMIYETNAEGAPTGTVRVYGPDGTAQGFGDATESFISQWLPK